MAVGASQVAAFINPDARRGTCRTLDASARCIRPQGPQFRPRSDHHPTQ
jgi:hypothetical protein